LLKTSPDEWVFPVCFDASGRWLMLLSSVGSDSIRLLAVDIESRREREIASMSGFDVEQTMIHPTTRVIEAVAFEPGRRECRVIEPSLKADFDLISSLDDGDFRVMSRDLDNSRWIVEFQGPHRPTRYFLWDRNTGQADFLFSDHPEFENFHLARMEPIQYRARDGMELHGYLATPPGIDARNLPLALGVHGGPWLRNCWTFNTWAQLIFGGFELDSRLATLVADDHESQKVADRGRKRFLRRSHLAAVLANRKFLCLVGFHSNIS
jgi:hypothetical protein